MVKWMWKKILRDLLDALKEVVDEWLAKEGKPLPKDRATQRAADPKVGTLTRESSAVEVGQSGLAATRDKANEILKGHK